MGIYDNVAPVTLWDRITQGQGAYKAYDARMKEAEGAAMGGLIDQYTKPQQMPVPGVLQMTPDNLGLSNQVYGQGVNQWEGPKSFQPNNEFFARAAAVPGYNSILNTLASSQGAMERQIQDQGWSVNPASNQAQETVIRRQTLDATIAHQKATEEEARRRTAISGGHLGLAQQEFNAKYQSDGKGGFVPRTDTEIPLEKNHVWAQDPVSGERIQAPAPGTTKWREEQGQADTLVSGIKGLKALDDHYANYGTFEVVNRDKAKVAEVNRQQAITAMGVLSNMGVLQPGDLDRLTKQLADPTDWAGGFTNTNAARAAVQEVSNRLQTAYTNKIRAVPTLRRATKPPEE